MAIIHLTADNFDNEVLNSDKPVLIDFFANWCGPCKMLSPILEEIAGERDDIKICKVNVDEEMQLASAFNVSSIPLLVLIKDKKVVAHSLGYQPKSQLLDMIQKNI